MNNELKLLGATPVRRTPRRAYACTSIPPGRGPGRGPPVLENACLIASREARRGLETRRDETTVRAAASQAAGVRRPALARASAPLSLCARPTACTRVAEGRGCGTGAAFPGVARLGGRHLRRVRVCDICDIGTYAACRTASALPRGDGREPAARLPRFSSEASEGARDRRGSRGTDYENQTEEARRGPWAALGAHFRDAVWGALGVLLGSWAASTRLVANERIGRFAANERVQARRRWDARRARRRTRLGRCTGFRPETSVRFLQSCTYLQSCRR